MKGSRVRVFQLKAAPDSLVLMPMDPSGGDTLSQLAGVPIDPTTWPALTVAPVSDGSAGSVANDLVWVWTSPALSVSAAVALRGLLKVNGQLLPLRANAQDYHVYSAYILAEALDERASQLQRFPSSGRVMQVDHFAFRAEVVARAGIFKIAQLPRAFTFVTDSFLSVVEAAGLTGFAPRLVWDSAASGTAA